MFPIMVAGSEFWNLDEIKSTRDKIVELVPTKSDSLVTFFYTSFVTNLLPQNLFPWQSALS